MAEFVSDCPRCGALNSTNDVHSSVVVGMQYNWMQFVELGCVCRNCRKMSIHLASRRKPDDKNNKYFGDVGVLNTLSAFNGSINHLVDFKRHITLRDRTGEKTPDFLPEAIETAIKEGNVCLANECWNAAAAMYRLALDLTTKGLLPENGEPAQKVRRSLGLRLQWLFDQSILNSDLSELADCVQQDGNDGSHDGSLKKIDAEDLHDFCYELVKRVFSEPKRLELAKQRREDRRKR